MSDGAQKEFTVTAKVDKDNKTTFVDQDGNELTTTVAARSSGTATGLLKTSTVNTALKEALEASDFGKDYAITATGATNKLVLEAKVAGAGTNHVTSIGFAAASKGGTAIGMIATVSGKAQIDAANSKKGEDAYETLNLADGVMYDGTNLDKAAFEINGEKFVFVKKGKLDDKALEALREAGVSHYVETAAIGAIAGGDVKNMVEKIKMATGLEVTQGTTSNTGVFTKGSAAVNTHIKLGDGTASKKNGGLTLQIGDTSDDFNKLTVSVNDMHAKALGLSDISIAKQTDAQASMEAIKAAINKVSSTRGDLGALQNRLDHTINNLSVMQENIQDAESTIRDVDVAQEMMAYTKNNILVQSAQAMLAQANQIPQGVLQLLQ